MIRLSRPCGHQRENKIQNSRSQRRKHGRFATHPGGLSIAKFSRDASRQHLREHAGIEPTLDQVSLQSLTHRRRLDIMPELNRYAVWK
jgi:hypothetical protein